MRMSDEEKQRVRAWALVVCAGRPDPDYLLYNVVNAAARRIGQHWHADDFDLVAVDDRAAEVCGVGQRWYARFGRRA
jgi:hypothetical protein